MNLFNLYFSTFLNSMICNIITDVTYVIMIFVFNTMYDLFYSHTGYSYSSYFLFGK